MDNTLRRSGDHRRWLVRVGMGRKYLAENGERLRIATPLRDVLGLAAIIRKV